MKYHTASLNVIRIWRALVIWHKTSRSVWLPTSITCPGYNENTWITLNVCSCNNCQQGGRECVYYRDGMRVPHAFVHHLEVWTRWTIFGNICASNFEVLHQDPVGNTSPLFQVMAPWNGNNKLSSETMTTQFMHKLTANVPSGLNAWYVFLC